MTARFKATAEPRPAMRADGETDGPSVGERAARDASTLATNFVMTVVAHPSHGMGDNDLPD